MGMWDEAFNRGEYKPTMKDALKAFIPVIGPILAAQGVLKKRQSAQDRWLTENMAYTNPEELDPMGQRVQDRMLTRTGGELSVPGLMAATAMQRQAQDPENMGNFGNVAMNTSTDLAAAGQTEAAATLAQLAHKNFQTPWKPSDASDKMKGPWTVVKGSDLGIEGKAASFPYKVRYNKDGTIQDVSGLGGQGMEVSVSSNMVSKPDISQAVIGYKDSIVATQQAVQTLDELTGILEANPTGGVSGWSGVVTGVASKIMNLAEFTAQDKQIMGKYEGALKNFASKYFPPELMQDRARAEAMTVELGYALARVNNMGTTGGGRGITDADMQFALKQLGSMGRVEDFKAVLEYHRNRMIGGLKANRAATEAIVAIGGEDSAKLGPLHSMYDQVVQPRVKSSDKPKSQYPTATGPDGSKLQLINGVWVPLNE